MIADELGAIGTQLHRYVCCIVLLAGPVMTPVNIDQERHNLTERQRRLARPVALAGL